MKIHKIIFSPTGGTKRACDYLCEGMDKEQIETDLCLKDDKIMLPRISKDDLAVIAMPVFAGRVPALAVERLRRIEGNNARCVIVAVYGNRAYDDALLEMQDVASGIGFQTIAAVGAIAEHSIARVYAAGRPDDKDRRTLSDFGVEIIKRLENIAEYTPLSLPGNRPYRQGNVGPFPEAGEGCSACGVCREQCPADAIPENNLRSVNKEKCISCMRCIAVCPSKVRNVGPVEAMVTEKLKPLCSARKDNELFI